MIIVNKSPNKILFYKLFRGEVFKDSYSNVCMKTEETPEGCNAVRLSDGSLDYIDKESEVERIKCQLVVE